MPDLDYRQPEAVQTVPDPVVRTALRVHVAVGDVCCEVHGETNAHYQVDHGYGVEVDPPEGHKTEDTELDRHDGEGDPERAYWVGDEDEGDDEHDDGCETDTLDGVRENHQELVEVDEVGVEDGHIVRRLVADCSQLPAHVE